MGILSKITRLKKNKTFNYSPRYYKNEGESSPFKIEHRFDKYRVTVSHNKGLKRKLNNAMDDLKRTGDRNLRLRMTIILTILILIFLFIIDFDLSIFLQK